MPSISPSRPTNRPNSVMFLTSPSMTVPTRWVSAKTSHGLRMVCLRPSDTRRLASSISSTMTSTSCEVETILPGWTFFWSRTFRDVDQTLDTGFQLDKGAVVGDVGHAAGMNRADRELVGDRIPRIGLKLFHAQADAVGVLVDLDDLDLDGFADRQDLGRVVDAAPGHVGDVQQAVNTAQVDEGTVFGDVLDHAFDRLTFGQVGDDFARCSARLSSRMARRETTMLPRRRSIFRIWNGCFRPISGPASRTGRTSTCEPGRNADGTAQIDGEAAFDAAEDGALTRFGGIGFFQTVQASFAAGLRARSRLARAFSTRSR